jgi:predicted  nucleic acid-binding Zn-ribbon protein
MKVGGEMGSFIDRQKSREDSIERADLRGERMTERLETARRQIETLKIERSRVQKEVWDMTHREARIALFKAKLEDKPALNLLDKELLRQLEADQDRLSQFYNAMDERLKVYNAAIDKAQYGLEHFLN